MGKILVYPAYVVLATVFGLLASPSAARASLVLTVPTVEIASPAFDTVVPVEIYFSKQIGDGGHALRSYSFTLDLLNASPAGVRFDLDFPIKPSRVEMTPVEHPYVLRDAIDWRAGEGVARPKIVITRGPPAKPVFNSLYIEAIGVYETAVDFGPGDGVFRAPVLVPAGTPAGFYPLRIGGESGIEISFGTTLGKPAAEIELEQGGIVVLPEPTSAFLLIPLFALQILRGRRPTPTCPPTSAPCMA